jgi:hypothetical protein
MISPHTRTSFISPGFSHHLTINDEAYFSLLPLKKSKDSILKAYSKENPMIF